MERFYTSIGGDGNRELDSRKQCLSTAGGAHRIAAATMLPSGIMILCLVLDLENR
jgi:hypothetical protein